MKKHWGISGGALLACGLINPIFAVPLSPSSKMVALENQTSQVMSHLSQSQAENSVFVSPVHLDHITASDTRLPPSLEKTLNLLNEALFQEAYQEGLLTHAPQVHTQSIRGADVCVLRGLQDKTVISTGIAPNMDLGLAKTKGLNPVLGRWFVLLHEAAHTQLGNIDHPFINPDWDPLLNQAMGDLLFDPGKIGSQTFGVFDETFADIYGGMMLVRLSPSKYQAIAMVSAIRNMRTLERKNHIPLTQDGLFDAHLQVDGLKFLDEDLSRPNYQEWVQTATPQQLQQAALWQASLLTTEWIAHEMPRFQDDFGWASTQGLLVNRVTAKLRLIEFRKERALSYLLAPQASDNVASLQAFDSPLFQAQLKNDAKWRTSFFAKVSPKTRYDLTRFIQGTTNEQENPLNNADFQTWINSTQDVVLTPSLIQADTAWLNSRFNLIKNALTNQRFVQQEVVFESESP